MRAMRYAWRRSQRALHLGDGLEQQPFTSQHDAAPQVRLDELRDVPVIVVLGERGAGKTVTLEQEHALLQAQGASVALVNLGQDVFDTSVAAADLRHLLRVPDSLAERYVLLDSLDEGLSDIPGLAMALLRELRETTPEQRTRIRLRITCRTTRWPEALEDGLRKLWTDEDDIALLALTPLTRQDMQTAAEAHNLDGAEFADLITARHLTALAEHPVTLIPLLKARQDGEALPETVSEAYQQACRTLCTESRKESFERRQARPAVNHLLEVARWVAAALQFSRGTALVDRAPQAGEIHLDTLSAARVPGLIPEEPCRRHELLHLTESALFTSVGLHRWVFAHRTYQEHLAAEYLRDRIDPVVRAELLWAGSGSARHILPEHEEVAARLATDDPALFDDLTAHDPWVTLLADLPALPATAAARQPRPSSNPHAMRLQRTSISPAWVGSTTLTWPSSSHPSSNQQHTGMRSTSHWPSQPTASLPDSPKPCSRSRRTPPHRPDCAPSRWMSWPRTPTMTTRRSHACIVCPAPTREPLPQLPFGACGPTTCPWPTTWNAFLPERPKSTRGGLTG